MGIAQIPIASSGLSASELITSPTWTEIANTSGSNVASISFTSLSGYRRYKIWWESFLPATNGESISLRINNDSGSNYLTLGTIERQGITSYAPSTTYYYPYIPLFFTGMSNGTYSGCGWVEIDNANSTGVKDLRHVVSGTTVQNYLSVANHYSMYKGTSAISSLQIIADGGHNFYLTNIRLYGGN